MGPDRDERIKDERKEVIVNVKGKPMKVFRYRCPLIEAPPDPKDRIHPARFYRCDAWMSRQHLTKHIRNQTHKITLEEEKQYHLKKRTAALEKAEYICRVQDCGKYLANVDSLRTHLGKIHTPYCIVMNNNDIYNKAARAGEGPLGELLAGKTKE